MKITSIQFGSIWLISLIVKLGLAAALPLANDEAYYWVWSHHLQWSYYDHPPMVAWLLWLGHAFEGLRDFAMPGAVRWPTVVVGHLTLLLLFRLVANRLRQPPALWLQVFLVSPFFGLGSLLATPDVPHVFTWALSLLAYSHFRQNPSAAAAAALGAALGLGFCSKYHIVLFVPLLLVDLAYTRRWRHFSPRYVLPAVVGGIVLSAPVWLWNVANDWVSFRFQLGHGLAQETKSLAAIAMQVGDYTAGQLALLAPLVLGGLWLRRRSRDWNYLDLFAWGPLLFFFCTSFRAPVEANWAIAGHLLLLATAAAAEHARRLIQVTAAVWASASVIVLFQAFSPATPFFGVAPERLKTYEFVRFAPLHALTEGATPVFASSYQMAGDLSYHARRMIPKLRGINRTDFFDFIPESDPKTPSFKLILEAGWTYPDWLKQAGYVERGRESIGQYVVVEFESAGS